MKLGALISRPNDSNGLFDIDQLNKQAPATQANKTLLLASKIKTTTLLHESKRLFYSILGDPATSSLAKAENIKILFAEVTSKLGPLALKQFVRAVFNVPALVSRFGLPIIGAVVDILQNPSPVAMATLSDVASAMLTERRNWTETDVKRYASITAGIYNPSNFTVGNCGPISHANVFNSMNNPSSRIFRNIQPDTEDRLAFQRLTKSAGVRESRFIKRPLLESSSDGYTKFLGELSLHTRDGRIVQLSILGSPPIVRNNTISKAPAPLPGVVAKRFFSYPNDHAINVLQVTTKSGDRQLAILDSQTGTAVVGNDAVEHYLRSVTGGRVQFIYRYQP